ncbi:MAG: 4'-phosphopantetheinyl transferase [Acidobacteria bacterium]|nr:MAG: 4'-phosphopantetheinyl transferase [Acidobacteriota bacterium]PYQ19255.1 MAG: 4'-phosphopantetheinyl transferase [Acidobacteriota bacterium]
MDPDGVVASALEVLEIAEVARLLEGGPHPFSAEELAFARARSDPERRLAARLAAKRAAARLLGGDVTPADVEVWRRPGGPPRLRLSSRAEDRLRERGADQTLVSLTHERRHAAAAVLLLRSR